MIRRAVLIAFAFCALVCTFAARAETYRLRTILRSGDNVGGAQGGTITRARSPRVSRSGAIAFPVEYQGGACPSGRICYGLVLHRKGAARLIAASAQEITGTDVRMTGQADGISLNDSGSVAFAGAYYGGDCSPPGNRCIVVMLHNDAGNRIIARQSRAAPSSGGGAFTMDLHSTALNDSGQLVFAGSYKGGNCMLSGSCGGVYRSSGGPAEPVAVWDQPVPGLAGARFFDVKAPSISNSGEIAVHAAFTGKCGPGLKLCFGILVVAPSARTVALEGGDVPGTGGGRYLGGKSSFGFGAPALNDSGVVAFVAEFGGGVCQGGRCSGVFAVGRASGRALAYSGQQAPGTNGGIFEQFSDTVAVNSAGAAAFHAVYRGGSCAAQRCAGLFAANLSGSLSVVALRGQVVPDAAGDSFDRLDQPALDDRGAIAFAAVSVSGKYWIVLAEPR